MRIGLFSATQVGVQVARLVQSASLPLACGVYDAAAPQAEIDELRQIWDGVHVLASDELVLPELDLILLAWWPYLLSPATRLLPKLGCLNFHPSQLPHNRGKNPNFWAVIEERPFGVTIHWLGDKVDAGPIAFQRSVEVRWEDTGGTLHAKAREAIVALFAENMSRIWAGDIPRVPQDLAAGSFHLSRELDSASHIELDKSYSGRQLLNLLRARTYPPYPGAWFEDDGQRYEVRIDICKANGPLPLPAGPAVPRSKVA